MKEAMNLASLLLAMSGRFLARRSNAAFNGTSSNVLPPASSAQNVGNLCQSKPPLSVRMSDARNVLVDCCFVDVDDASCFGVS